MPVLELRADFDSAQLRRRAAASSDADHARRLLAIAAAYEGHSRAEAARLAGMDRQTLRDWVVRFNALGPDALFDRPPPAARRGAALDGGAGGRVGPSGGGRAGGGRSDPSGPLALGFSSQVRCHRFGATTLNPFALLAGLQSQPRRLMHRHTVNSLYSPTFELAMENIKASFANRFSNKAHLWVDTLPDNFTPRYPERFDFTGD
jgi:hypothetical protein